MACTKKILVAGRGGIKSVPGWSGRMINSKDKQVNLSRVVNGRCAEGDADTDRTLRPRSLQEYIGQAKIKENLDIFIQAARNRGEALDHILFHGPPGLGKTTLAHIISHEMGVQIRTDRGTGH